MCTCSGVVVHIIVTPQGMSDIYTHFYPTEAVGVYGTSMEVTHSVEKVQSKIVAIYTIIYTTD